ncbi:MAG: glycosyltransferase [Bacteroidales bacterium]|nr:glycosyltransferase [Bacteroidales bacterium]
MEVQLSAVIISHNEEKNIGRCLESLKDLADEIVVVDSYSSDRTGEICKSFGAVFIQHIFHGHIEQKNWAIQQASSPYILSLDADECLSEALARSIAAVKKDWVYDGYYFNRLTNYCGKWIRHTSWYPSPKLRLWDSRKGSWGGVNPHDKFILDKGATKKHLKGEILHYSYYNLSEHISQINAFSTIAANSYFQQGKRSRFWDILVRPMSRFLKDYLLRLGILDGYYGLQISVNSAHAVFLKYVKLRILHQEQKERQTQTICFFNSTPAWGGGEKWHFDFSSGLYKRGQPILVFTNSRGELRRRVAEAGIPAYGIRVANLSFLNPVKVLKIAGILKREKVRLIIMNLSADMKVAGLAAKIAGVKRIIYRRGSAIPIRNSMFNRFLFRRVLDEILANSHETKRTLLKNNPGMIDPVRIRVIYNGLRFDQFETGQQNPCYRRVDGEVILGNAGRLVKQKAQEYLIDLAVELKKRQKKFKILIAGEGRLETQLREYAKLSGVEDSIVFLGFMKDMKSFLDAIDIFVLTSRWEGFGYVIVEAMANSRPVVAFDVSSNPEIIEDGKNGYLIPPFDIRNLADRVVQLIEDQSLRNSFASNAKKSVYERFSYDRILDTVEEYLMGEEVHDDMKGLL